jgi:ABC-type polysaccharide/polyol phosphate transport system ATPase subunit
MTARERRGIAARDVWKQYQLGTGGLLVRTLERWSPRVAKRLGVTGDFWALREVSFDVAPGEAVGIVGRNGAGKSTLLKVLCGVTVPSRGTVEIHGRIAPLIEVGAGFHPELTGRENIFLNAAIMGMTRAEIGRKFDEIVAFSGLEKFIDTPVKKYSSGMLVRLGFSVSVHVDPDALLVDEVLAVGDLAFVLKSYRKIQDIRKGGVPVLLVSHNLQLIRNFCDRAVWIDGGRVAMVGSPSDVCSAYSRSVFEKDDIGSDSTAAEVHRVHADESVSITQVEITDAEGVARPVFATGEPMQIRVRVRSTRATGPLLFHIAVYQEESGALLIDHNNADDGRAHPGHAEAGESEIVMSFPRQPFIAGPHRVSVIVAENVTAHVVDWHEKMYGFKVAGGAVGYGSFHAFPEWRVIGPAAPEAPARREVAEASAVER